MKSLKFSLVAPAPTSERKEYQILRKLAVGGMAEIYLARTLGLGGFEKYVVLKRILPTFANDAKFIEMFLDEARLAALLHHQNIAQVHDIGQANGSYFFTMEYLHGVDIRQLWSDLYTKNAALPMSHALTIVAGAAAGLHYAHEKLGSDGQPLRIVHRDVSLSNIVVTYDGGVKLVDFGVARAAARDSKTRTGSLKGKVGYMSPEQCRGKQLDRRSDVFSLGVVLFELTTGDRPFGDAEEVNDYSTMFQIVEAEPTMPTEIDPDYPAELERIVLRALAKDPDDRYPTSRALLADIEAFAANHRLPLSTSALAGFMEDIYGHPPEPWHLLEHEAPPTQNPVRRTITFADPDPQSSHPNAATIFAADGEFASFGAPPLDNSSHRSRSLLPVGYDALNSASSPRQSSHLGRAVSQGIERQRIGRSLFAVVMVIAGIAAGLGIAWQLSRSSESPASTEQAAEGATETNEPSDTDVAAAAASQEPTEAAVDKSATADEEAKADPIDLSAVAAPSETKPSRADESGAGEPADESAEPTEEPDATAAADSEPSKTSRRNRDAKPKSDPDKRSAESRTNRRNPTKGSERSKDGSKPKKNLAEKARNNADLEW